MQTEIENVRAHAELLYSQAAIDTALDTMAMQINQLLTGRNPLVLCVMNGGLVTAGHLLTRLTMPLTLDAINASRYQNNTVGDDIEWITTPRATLKDRTILIIDDILDAGITLRAIYDYCLQAGASSIYTAVLLEKQLSHQKPITADFVGLSVPDRYVFGYGMDYKGYWRNANGIYACAE
ncbi:MAG TPA: hypoxanthine-guanine phosphoribosyltransferase [Methylococcaceae bacterium]|nr:hypoxanthine-guanine phosphoribosyltransferase [Methylococcaceae bacterium]